MAKIFYDGFDDISIGSFWTEIGGEMMFHRTSFSIAAELEAYDQDMKWAATKGINSWITKKHKEQYAYYYQLLKSGNRPETKILHDQLQKIFFREWMVDEK